ncbi:DMT family transporter [Deinococcus antarcticus]|uniref:DMT family transporter n=1 Tax=Deinococcus antarcticus TaxID=1298767 RepID=A0ABV8A4A5_9DEIO
MTTSPVQNTQKNNTSSGWGWVVLAGLFEMGFTYALKMWQHNDNYGAMFLVCAIVSFECLSQSLKTLPISLAYAVWTGIGSVGTVILGILLFGESLSPVRILLLLVLIGAILGLKLVDGRGKAEAQ